MKDEQLVQGFQYGGQNGGLGNTRNISQLDQLVVPTSQVGNTACITQLGVEWRGNTDTVFTNQF